MEIEFVVLCCLKPVCIAKNPIKYNVVTHNMRIHSQCGTFEVNLIESVLFFWVNVDDSLITFMPLADYTVNKTRYYRIQLYTVHIQLAFAVAHFIAIRSTNV